LTLTLDQIIYLEQLIQAEDIIGYDEITGESRYTDFTRELIIELWNQKKDLEE
jgi:hypothetical protein